MKAGVKKKKGKDKPGSAPGLFWHLAGAFVGGGATAEFAADPAGLHRALPVIFKIATAYLAAFFARFPCSFRICGKITCSTTSLSHTNSSL
ncbi:hypothetical protein EIO60_00670|nr:hypothetical protein [Candidatus Pantoea persica]